MVERFEDLREKSDVSSRRSSSSSDLERSRLKVQVYDDSSQSSFKETQANDLDNELEVVNAAHSDSASTSGITAAVGLAIIFFCVCV